MRSAEIFFSVCLADHDNGIENRCLALRDPLIISPKRNHV